MEFPLTLPFSIITNVVKRYRVWVISEFSERVDSSIGDLIPWVGCQRHN